MIETPLFEAQTIFLSAVDLDTDPGVIAGWTYDLEIARRFLDHPAKPMSGQEMKKYLENRIKQADESHKELIFTIKLKDEDELAGLVTIGTEMWSHGVAKLDILVGPSENRWEALREALQLALRYIFEELNLFRVDVILPEYSYEAAEVYEQAGFNLEVRQREAIFRADHYWDLFFYGLLCSEWRPQQGEE